MTSTGIGRRGAIGLGAAAAVALGSARTARAQPAEVKVALLAPVSGPWARQGLLMKSGAELAVADINAAGGIKALGGAKMRLIIYDAGDSAEKAKNAAQRMVSEQPDLVGGTGAWLSTFTLAVTEVTERAELPWLTVSFSDAITNRGFRYIFQTALTADRQAVTVMDEMMDLAKLAGATVQRFGILADNTASTVSFLRPIRETELAKHNLKLVLDEIYTPPLADVTSMVQRVRSTRPQLLFMAGTNVSDNKLLFDKMNEFGLGRGKVPFFGSGAAMVAPEMLAAVGKEELDNFMSCVANWAGKGQEQLVAHYKEKSGEPFMGQDAVQTYCDVQILKECVERAGVADKHKVAEQLRSIDLTDGPALLMPGRRIKFDDKGRIVGGKLVIAQWQNGTPVPVFPQEMALAKANWPQS